MTALLTADEAERLRVGVNVIVRAGDPRNIVRKVTVILDYGGQGFRDVTAEAWAVLEVERPVWPPEFRLVSIHMTEEEAAAAYKDSPVEHSVLEQQPFDGETYPGTSQVEGSTLEP